MLSKITFVRNDLLLRTSFITGRLRTGTVSMYVPVTNIYQKIDLYIKTYLRFGTTSIQTFNQLFILAKT